MIHLQNVRKEYRTPGDAPATVIDIADFKLDTGEHAALVGASGSGKTTLLHIIAGILTPDSGKVIYDFDAAGATDITKLSEPYRDILRGRYVGCIFQTHHLLQGFTALENVQLGMTFTGRPPEPEWARQLLADVGLADRMHYKPEKLSLGQQQRVACARALANRPKLVLADEPTGALDAKNAQQTLELITRLCKSVNASLLLVTHDTQISRQLPRMVVLEELNRAAAPAQGRG